GTRDSGLLRLHGGQVTRVVKGLPDQKINSLVVNSNHTLWIGTDNGIAEWNGTEITRAGLPASLARVRALSMIRDADSNLWIVTTAGQLLRVNEHGVAQRDELDRGEATVTAVFEDREKNLWIGTTRGLERIRDAVFSSYSTVQGLPAGGYGPIYAESDRIWVAPAVGGLYR